MQSKYIVNEIHFFEIHLNHNHFAINYTNNLMRQSAHQKKTKTKTKTKQKTA